MNKLTKFIPCSLMFAVAGVLAASTISSHAQGAVATISGVQNGANWDYTITLQNTGNTDLNAFWYGWTQNGNNLPSDPLNAANSLGWDNDLSGNSIIFENSSGSALAAGDFATFTFESISTPAEITAGSSGQSVAYVNGNDFSQNIPGDSTDVFSPSLVAPVPEPSAIGLLTAGGLILAGWQRSRKPLVQAAMSRK